jgi:hypothetical protein
MEKFKVKISRVLKIISFTLLLSIVSLLTSIAHANPIITRTSINSINDLLVVTFNENVFGTATGIGGGSSGDLEAADFSLSISGGTATIGSVTPTSIIKVTQSVWLLRFSTSDVADGSEVITVVPASGASIYNAGGDVASTTQSNNTATFNAK